MDATKRALLIVLAAAIIVIAIIAGYVFIGEKPPAAAGEIVKLDVVPIHSQLRIGEGAQGLQGGMDTYDQLLVLAQIRIQNQAKLPLFVREISASLELGNGDLLQSTAASKTDFQSAFVAYSQLTPFRGEPLPSDLTLQPGQACEGLVIFHYPVTKEQWDDRHSFHAVVSFQYQKDLLLPWPPGKR